MGTCNFWGMEEFGYVTYVEEYDEEWYKEEYPDEEGYRDEDRWRAFEESRSYHYEMEYDDVSKALDEFNGTLIFHRFEVHGGYYDGLEIRYAKDRWGHENACRPHDPDDWAELAEMLDEHDGYYDYSDRPRHQRRARRLYEEECDRIIEWFESTASEYGFSPMGCVARFGNGEAWYRRCRDYPSTEHHVGLDLGYGQRDRDVDDWSRDNMFAPLWASLETASQTPFMEVRGCTRYM